MASNVKLFARVILNPNNVKLLHSPLFRQSPQCIQSAFLNQSQRCIAIGTNVQDVAKRATGGASSDAPGDKYTEEHRKKMGYYYSLLIGSAVGVVGSSYLIYKKLTIAKAEQRTEESYQAEIESGSLHKSEAGFKERKIIEYENRIRAYSTPDKIFRYFASLQDSKTGDIYMNPEDFVRALTPDTMQPKDLGLDKFRKFDMKHVTPYTSECFGDDSIFHCLGEGGLISFSDYIFFLTVLGTSARHIDIAFKMFDLNGDGEVSLEEFKKVRSLFLNMTTTGSRHRDRKTTGNVLSNSVNSGLEKNFFGEDGQGLLTAELFVKFKRKLQEEVMFLEFNSFSPKDGSISEKQFADILLTYANFHNAKRMKVIKRIKSTYGVTIKKGVKFQDYLDFFNFLLNIRDVEMALSFHTIAGQPIDKSTLQQVAKTVTQIDLSDHIIDIVFCIFDENEDGQLSNKEFVAVMKDKMFRGLNKPKDTGFTRFLSAILTCAKLHMMEYWFTSEQPH